MADQAAIPNLTSTDAVSFEKLQSELFPGEKLLWHGRPLQGMHFERSDIGGYVIGILLLGTVVVLSLLIFEFLPVPDQWKEGASALEPKVACAFWSVALLPIALYCLGGGKWLDARFRSKLFYGVTNERILILREQRRNSQALTSLRLRDVPHLSLIVNQDGTGSLIFAPRPVSAPNQSAAYGINFRLIPEVRKVYTLIRSIQRDPA